MCYKGKFIPIIVHLTMTAGCEMPSAYSAMTEVIEVKKNRDFNIFVNRLDMPCSITSHYSTVIKHLYWEGEADRLRRDITP